MKMSCGRNYFGVPNNMHVRHGDSMLTWSKIFYSVVMRPRSGLPHRAHHFRDYKKAELARSWLMDGIKECDETSVRNRCVGHRHRSE
jgi:hypothetical protein